MHVNSHQRYEAIMELLLTKRSVSVGELSGQMNVTGKTIREDLAKLEEKGLLIRVHGGAMLAQGDQFGILSAKEQETKRAAEKAEIARTALDLIRENDVVALDSGSTTLAIAKALPNTPVTVITNDLRIVTELMGKDQVKLVVPGGYRVRNTLVSPESVSYIKGFNIGIAFVAAAAIHLEYGLSNYVGDLIEYKKALVNSAQRVYAVADHSKFGQSALQTYAKLHEVDAVITDSGLPEETARAFRSKGITLLTANP